MYRLHLIRGRGGIVLCVCVCARSPLRDSILFGSRFSIFIPLLLNGSVQLLFSSLHSSALLHDCASAAACFFLVTLHAHLSHLSVCAGAVASIRRHVSVVLPDLSYNVVERIVDIDARFG